MSGVEKTVIHGLPGLRNLAGKELGTSAWREMRFGDIVAFADATGDRQWIHVDGERAKRESPFGAPIAHGYFTVALIAGQFFEVVETRGFKMVLNYGLNKVRFPAPLKAGSRYRLKLALGEVKEREKPLGAEAVMSASIEIEGEAKPACVAEIVYWFLT